eukprot:XP_001707211.1 Hypothetical protein GL50803_87772 [Giardia lamblia ATCC 50803]
MAERKEFDEGGGHEVLLCISDSVIVRSARVKKIKDRLGGVPPSVIAQLNYRSKGHGPVYSPHLHDHGRDHMLLNAWEGTQQR